MFLVDLMIRCGLEVDSSPHLPVRTGVTLTLMGSDEAGVNDKITRH